MSAPAAVKSMSSAGIAVISETDTTPCKKCGGTLRYASTGACVPCNRKLAAEQRVKNKARRGELEAALEAARKKIAEQREIIATLNAFINSNAKPTSNTPDLLGDL